MYKSCIYYLNAAYLKNDFAQNWINSFAKGATFREITLTKLRELPILVPPMELQLKFGDNLTRIIKCKNKSKSQINHSLTLFQTLLQKAFKGELV